MAKQVKQFRYYSEDAIGVTSNYPSNINKYGLVSGSNFANYMPISKLGIFGFNSIISLTASSL